MHPTLRFGLAWITLVGGPLAAAADRPNLLVILSDDHSAAHVGAYGNPDVRTPRLDRLAAEGARLDRAYVTSPQCAPSRSSLVTGRMPMAIGTSRFSATVPPDMISLPELLRTAGYFTGFAGRPYHLDGSRNTPVAIRDHLRKEGWITFARRLDFLRESENDAQALAQWEEYLRERPRDRPFYLQLGFSDPHRILTAPKVHDPTTLTLPPHYPDTPLVRADLAAYYDEVARLDGNVGRVLDRLDAEGLTASTLVVFMGDNGASQFRGKGNLNELGIRVPLIVRWPGVVPAGTATGALFSGEDLTPTLLAAAGIEPPSSMTGRALLGAWTGRAFVPREHVLAERGAHGVALPYNAALFDVGRTVVTNRYKLIYNATWQLPYAALDFGNQPVWKDLEERHAAGTLEEPFRTLYFAPHRPMFELYDLAADPWELVNLSGRPELREHENALRLVLCRWMIRDRDHAPLPLPISP